MQRLLILLLLGIIASVFADTAIDFDKKRVECHKTKRMVKLNDGMKRDDVIRACAVNARKDGDPAGRVRFQDDLAHKEVYCEFDKDGAVKVGSCFIVG